MRTESGKVDLIEAKAVKQLPARAGVVTRSYDHRFHPVGLKACKRKVAQVSASAPDANLAVGQAVCEISQHFHRDGADSHSRQTQFYARRKMGDRYYYSVSA